MRWHPAVLPKVGTWRAMSPCAPPGSHPLAGSSESYQYAKPHAVFAKKTAWGKDNPSPNNVGDVEPILFPIIILLHAYSRASWLIRGNICRDSELSRYSSAVELLEILKSLFQKSFPGGFLRLLYPWFDRL